MLYAIFTIISLVISGANAEATCLSGDDYTWGYNSLNQSPCQVAGRLLSICVGGTVTIAALNPNSIYGGAQEGGGGSDCRCSSVYYSMLSACAQCQGRAWLDWPDQRYYCKDVYHQYLPFTVPSDTQVPSWAYLDIASLTIFNLDAARNSIKPVVPLKPVTPVITPKPVSTPPPNRPVVTQLVTSEKTIIITSADSRTPSPQSSSPTSTPRSTSLTTVTDDGPSISTGDKTPIPVTPSSHNGAPDTINANSNAGGSVSSPSNSTPVGAIVGGIVGSLAVLALLTLGVIWMRRKPQSGAGRLDTVEVARGMVGTIPNMHEDTVPPAYSLSPHTTGTSGGGSANPFITSGKGHVALGVMGMDINPMSTGTGASGYGTGVDPDSGSSVAGTTGNNTADDDYTQSGEQTRGGDSARLPILSPVRPSIRKF